MTDYNHHIDIGVVAEGVEFGGTAGELSLTFKVTDPDNQTWKASFQVDKTGFAKGGGGLSNEFVMEDPHGCHDNMKASCTLTEAIFTPTVAGRTGFDSSQPGEQLKQTVDPTTGVKNETKSTSGGTDKSAKEKHPGVEQIVSKKVSIVYQITLSKCPIEKGRFHRLAKGHVAKGVLVESGASDEKPGRHGPTKMNRNVSVAAKSRVSKG